ARGFQRHGTRGRPRTNRGTKRTDRWGKRTIRWVTRTGRTITRTGRAITRTARAITRTVRAHPRTGRPITRTRPALPRPGAATSASSRVLHAIDPNPRAGAPPVTPVELSPRPQEGDERLLGRTTLGAGTPQVPPDGSTGIGSLALAGLGADGATLVYGRTPLL